MFEFAMIYVFFSNNMIYIFNLTNSFDIIYVIF